jgi:hypothetical protein
LRFRSRALLAVLAIGCGDAVLGTDARAQPETRIVLKAGESVEIRTVYYVSNCRSIMIGLPEVEVLEGPPQIALSVKEGMVLPRRQNCANRIPGGTLMATAKDVLEPLQGKVTYRLKYKTKDGERQRGGAFLLSLFP